MYDAKNVIQICPPSGSIFSGRSYAIIGRVTRGNVGGQHCLKPRHRMGYPGFASPLPLQLQFVLCGHLCRSPLLGGHLCTVLYISRYD